MSTLFVMTIDTEEEWDWASGWSTSRPSVTNIRQIPRFQELCSRLGVYTTYFVNHAVLDNPDSRSIVLDLAGRAGIEVGMHIHPWNTPPVVGSGAVAARESFIHNLPADLIRAKLASTFELFSKCGLKPTSFRGGRYSSGGVIHEFLRDHVFMADSSVLPFSSWQDDGAPDYRARGPQPVRHSPRHKGDAPFWEIPLTLGFTRGPDVFWSKYFDLAGSRWLRPLRLNGIADRIGLVSRVWLNFENPQGRKMLALLERLRSEDKHTFHLCFTMHSSSFLVGGNPYTSSPADVDRIFHRIEEVFETVAGWANFRPATVSGIAQALEETYHARARDQSS